MKRILCLLICLPVVFACSKSPIEKAEALIKKEVQKILYYPNSYEVADTQLDSAFSPKHDPAAIAIILDICERAVEFDELETQMKNAKSTMSLFSGPYVSSYGKNSYAEAKKIYDEAEAKMIALTKKVDKYSDELEKMSEKEPEFIGYWVRHSYRAQNGNGNVLMGKMDFLINKDLTAIIAQYDEEQVEMLEAFKQKVKELADEEDLLDE